MVAASTAGEAGAAGASAVVVWAAGAGGACGAGAAVCGCAAGVLQFVGGAPGLVLLAAVVSAITPAAAASSLSMIGTLTTVSWLVTAEWAYPNRRWPPVTLGRLRSASN